MGIDSADRPLCLVAYPFIFIRTRMSILLSYASAYCHTQSHIVIRIDILSYAALYCHTHRRIVIQDFRVILSRNRYIFICFIQYTVF